MEKGVNCKDLIGAVNIFIGPESDDWLPLSPSHLLTSKSSVETRPIMDGIDKPVALSFTFHKDN